MCVPNRIAWVCLHSWAEQSECGQLSCQQQPGLNANWFCQGMGGGSVLHLFQALEDGVLRP